MIVTHHTGVSTSRISAETSSMMGQRANVHGNFPAEISTVIDSQETITSDKTFVAFFSCFLKQETTINFALAPLFTQTSTFIHTLTSVWTFTLALALALAFTLASAFTITFRNLRDIIFC